MPLNLGLEIRELCGQCFYMCVMKLAWLGKDSSVPGLIVMVYLRRRSQRLQSQK